MLSNFFKVTSKIPTINNGGCLIGVYAAYLYLEKNGCNMSSFKVIQFALDEYPIECNKKWIEGTFDNVPQSSWHFAFLYEGETYDAEGKLNCKEYASKYRIIMDVLDIDDGLLDEFFIQCINEDQWNDTFERDIYVPLIASELDIDLSEVLCEFD
jgi:hypothetical protein